MKLLDADRLTAFLHRREDATRSLVMQATYAGLASRVERGEFDADDRTAR